MAIQMTINGPNSSPAIRAQSDKVLQEMYKNTEILNDRLQFLDWMKLQTMNIIHPERNEEFKKVMASPTRKQKNDRIESNQRIIPVIEFLDGELRQPNLNTLEKLSKIRISFQDVSCSTSSTATKQFPLPSYKSDSKSKTSSLAFDSKTKPSKETKVLEEIPTKVVKSVQFPSTIVDSTSSSSVQPSTTPSPLPLYKQQHHDSASFNIEAINKTTQNDSNHSAQTSQLPNQDTKNAEVPGVQLPFTASSTVSNTHTLNKDTPDNTVPSALKDAQRQLGNDSTSEMMPPRAVAAATAATTAIPSTSTSTTNTTSSNTAAASTQRTEIPAPPPIMAAVSDDASPVISPPPAVSAAAVVATAANSSQDSNKENVNKINTSSSLPPSNISTKDISSKAQNHTVAPSVTIISPRLQDTANASASKSVTARAPSLAEATLEHLQSMQKESLELLKNLKQPTFVYSSDYVVADTQTLGWYVPNRSDSPSKYLEADLSSLRKRDLSGLSSVSQQSQSQSRLPPDVTVSGGSSSSGGGGGGGSSPYIARGFHSRESTPQTPQQQRLSRVSTPQQQQSQSQLQQQSDKEASRMSLDLSALSLEKMKALTGHY